MIVVKFYCSQSFQFLFRKRPRDLRKEIKEILTQILLFLLASTNFVFFLILSLIFDR
jgi:hypothetical protein